MKCVRPGLPTGTSCNCGFTQGGRLGGCCMCTRVRSCTVGIWAEMVALVSRLAYMWLRRLCGEPYVTVSSLALRARSW